jgi:hypothetical protein
VSFKARVQRAERGRVAKMGQLPTTGPEVGWVENTVRRRGVQVVFGVGSVNTWYPAFFSSRTIFARRALALGAYRGTAFFIANSLVQNLPNETAQAVSHGPDRLLVFQARLQTLKDYFQNAPFILTAACAA